MGLLGPPRDAKLKAWKIHTCSLCWTAVLTGFLSNSHRRSNPPGYSTHPDMVWLQKENSRNGWGISRSRQGLRQFHTGSEVPDKIKEQPVFSHFPILSSKYDNCDESSTGSGVRRLGHQLWSVWTKNWVANRSKPTKREEGARQPSKAAHLMLLKLKPQPAHSREMARVMILIKTLPLCLMELQHHWRVKEYMIHVEGQTDNSGKVKFPLRV